MSTVFEYIGLIFQLVVLCSLWVIVHTVPWAIAGGIIWLFIRRQRQRRGLLLLPLFLPLVLFGGRPAIAQAPHVLCFGDCNLDGRVTVNEVITGVNIALGVDSFETCPAMNCNAHFNPGTINCLVAAVANAMEGCDRPSSCTYTMDGGAITIHCEWPLE